MAVDRSGRGYVVFSTRGLTSTPDARIAVTHVVYPSRARVRFSDGDDTPETPVRKEPQATWSTPVPIDPDLARRGHQIMPTALVPSERLQVAWIDLREDHTWGEYLTDSRGVLQETRMLSDERL